MMTVVYRAEVNYHLSGDRVAPVAWITADSVEELERLAELLPSNVTVDGSAIVETAEDAFSFEGGYERSAR